MNDTDTKTQNWDIEMTVTTGTVSDSCAGLVTLTIFSRYAYSTVVWLSSEKLVSVDGLIMLHTYTNVSSHICYKITHQQKQQTTNTH